MPKIDYNLFYEENNIAEKENFNLVHETCYNKQANHQCLLELNQIKI